jgi:hypothetical protein
MPQAYTLICSIANGKKAAKQSDDCRLSYRNLTSSIAKYMCASGAPVAETAGENVRYWPIADIG